MLKLVDKVAQLKISQQTRQKLLKNRLAMERQKQKEKLEEKEEEKTNKKREEKEKFVQKLKQLPPDEQRRMEEKKHKKDLQKSKSRMMKVMRFT